MSFTVDYFPSIDASTAAQKYVVLSGTPILANNVAMDLIKGTAQAINGDFGVDGTTVKWDSTTFSLYSMISAGDSIRVIYDKS